MSSYLLLKQFFIVRTLFLSDPVHVSLRKGVAISGPNLCSGEKKNVEVGQYDSHAYRMINGKDLLTCCINDGSELE